MKRILAALALGLLSCLCVTYGAGTTANLTWSAPTTYTDGSAIASGDIASYTISWAPASGQSGPTGTQSATASAVAATVPVACGSVTFTISVTTSSTAKYPNVTSGPSNAVPYATGVTCTINPPSGLAVH